MENLGYIFKKVRLEKKYTLKDVAEDIMSISLLSKFERGETEITISKFLLLLDKLNVTLEEYAYIYNGYDYTNFEKRMKEINQAYLNNNLNYLIKLQKEETKHWNNSKRTSHKLNAVMITAIIHDLNNEIIIDKEDVNFLTNYLFDIENWGLYEVILFGNSMNIIKKETVITLSKEMLVKVNLYREIKKVKEEIIRVLINTIIFCLQRRYIESMHFFLVSIERILNETPMCYFEKVKVYYLKGIYYLLNDNYDTGRKMCLDAIRMMKIVGDKEMAFSHEEFMNDYLKK